MIGLLQGDRFIDAAAKARRAARDCGGNTWAAYQCYGDPEWTFVRQVGDAQGFRTPWSRRFVGVASVRGLKLALDTIAVKSRFQKRPDEQERHRIDDLRDGIRHLEERFDKLWGHIGDVAESFGTARAEIGDSAEAIEWYRRAVSANDGTASLKAAEQHANLRARLAWKKVSRLVDAAGGPLPGGAALQSAANEILEAIKQLKTLIDLQETMERDSLIGSAYKRLSMVWAPPGSRTKRDAIEQMKIYYALAEKIGRENKSTDLFYPALNHIVADLAMNAGDPMWPGLDDACVEAVRSGLAIRARDDPNFWSVVGEIELRMYDALSRRDLAAVSDRLAQEFGALKQRVPAAKMWSTVHDNARFLLGLYAKRALLHSQSPDGPATQAHQAEARAASDLLASLHRLAGGDQDPSAAQAVQERQVTAGSAGQTR